MEYELMLTKIERIISIARKTINELKGLPLDKTLDYLGICYPFLYLRNLDLSDEILFLMKHKRKTAVPIILRVFLENTVNFFVMHNRNGDAKFIVYETLIEERKQYEGLIDTIDSIYLNQLSKETLHNTLNKIDEEIEKLKNQKAEKLSFYEKMEQFDKYKKNGKAIYNSLYRNLCSETHPNVFDLKKKYIKIKNNVEYFYYHPEDYTVNSEIIFFLDFILRTLANMSVVMNNKFKIFNDAQIHEIENLLNKGN